MGLPLLSAPGSVFCCVLVFSGLMCASVGRAQDKEPVVFAATLTSSDRSYVKLDDVYIAPRGSMARWSKNSKTLLVVTESDRISVRERRRAAQRNNSLSTPPSETMLLRYAVESGRRDVLYRAANDELIENAQFVGSGSDVLFSVCRTDTQGIQTRRLFFASENGMPQQVGAPFDVSIAPEFSASSVQSRALMALTTKEKRLQVFLLGFDGIRPVTLSEDWQLSQFLPGVVLDSGRLSVIRFDKGQQAITKILDIDFTTGAVTELTPEMLQKEQEKQKQSSTRKKSLFLYEYYRVARAARDELSDTPPTPPALQGPSPPVLRDLDIVETGAQPHRLAMVRSMEGYEERSPDGLKFAYQTRQGFFVGELTAALPSDRK